MPNTTNYTDNSGSHADIIMTSNGSTQTKKIISIIFGACVKCDIFFKNFEGPGAAKRNSCSTNKTGKVVRGIGRFPTLKAKIDTEEVLTTS